jgi:hypothetical protein
MAKRTTDTQEFRYLPMKSIILEKQIRSTVDKKIESFKALVSSIKDKGVLEPIIVTPKGDGYLLLCGERRFHAAYEAGLEIIPVRIVDTISQRDEIILYQLTENLQREDLNPIDQAKGILAYIQAKHPDKGYYVDRVINELMNYNLKSDSVPKEMTDTVSVISQITAKSTRTMLRTISILKLVPKIQDEIVAGTLPVSQGYIFAANFASPDFFTISDEIMEKPVTNAKLERILTEYKKAKPRTNNKPIPMKKKVEVLQNAKSHFENKTGKYTVSHLQAYLQGLETLTSLIKQQIETISKPETTTPVRRPPVAPS